MKMCGMGIYWYINRTRSSWTELHKISDGVSHQRMSVMVEGNRREMLLTSILRRDF